MLATVALAVVFGLAARVIELRPLELLRDAGNIGVFLKGYLNPSFAHVGEYAWQSVVTLCIALWGTLLAIAIAVPLGLLGARNISPHPVIHFAARRTMDVLRAVNEFVFALMFVTAVGLGPVRRACSRWASTRAACSASSSARPSRRSIPGRPRVVAAWARAGST